MLASGLPVGHLGGVSDTMSKIEDGWRVMAFPADWDPADPDAPIRTVTVFGRVTYPERFLMSLQTTEMLERANPTAIVVGLSADEAGVTVSQVFGVGVNWIDDLEKVVKTIPPAMWDTLAMRRVVEFLMLDDDQRRALGPTVASLAIPKFEASALAAPSPSTGGTQRRRQITPEHLQEVAKIYREALASDAPPTRAVQHHFDVSHSTAAKWVGKARSMGLLPAVD